MRNMAEVKAMLRTGSCAILSAAQRHARAPRDYLIGRVPATHPSDILRRASERFCQRSDFS